MDNEVDAKNIANLFKEKCCKLYNRYKLGPYFERSFVRVLNVEIDTLDIIESGLLKESLFKKKPQK